MPREFRLFCERIVTRDDSRELRGQDLRRPAELRLCTKFWDIENKELEFEQITWRYQTFEPLGNGPATCPGGDGTISKTRLPSRSRHDLRSVLSPRRLIPAEMLPLACGARSGSGASADRRAS